MTTISLDEVIHKELTSAEAKNMSDVQRADVINQILTGQNSMYKSKIEKLNEMENKIEFSKWCVYADILKKGNFYSTNANINDPRENLNFVQYMKQEGLEYIYDPIDKKWYSLGGVINIFLAAYSWFKSKQHEYYEDREAFAATYRNTKEMQVTGKLYSLVYLWGKLPMLKRKESNKELTDFISAIRKYFSYNVEKYESIYKINYNFNNIGYNGQAITCVECPVANVSDNDILAANELRQSLNTIINNLRMLFITSDKPINICLNNAVLGTLQNTTDTTINIEQKVNCVIEQNNNSEVSTSDKNTNNLDSNLNMKEEINNNESNVDNLQSPTPPATKEEDKKSSKTNIIIGVIFLVIFIALIVVVIMAVKNKRPKVVE